MTTVGFGDYYPTTAIGYVTAALIMMLGIMVTALPIVIIGSNFSIVSDYNKERQRKKAADNAKLENSIKTIEVTNND